MATQDAAWFREMYAAIGAEIGKTIVGQEPIVEGVLVGMVADAHILLEGMPGLGKTLLVRALSQVLDLRFSRIQFTPDMMPADVTGTNVLSADGARRNEFRHGPIFANIVLADEINRATPKTQSAMLEAMQERSSNRRVAYDTNWSRRFLSWRPRIRLNKKGPTPCPKPNSTAFFLSSWCRFRQRRQESRA